MKRSLKLELNKFPSIPSRLQNSSGGPLAEISIDTLSLYHHYHLDNYGIFPQLSFLQMSEMCQFLTTGPDFRYTQDGYGYSKQAKRNRSSEIGQAFCRYFLYDYLNVNYFAHVEHVIGRTLPGGFGVWSLQRAPGAQGDLPDYVCARKIKDVFIAEAKGRYGKVDFNNAEFARWRQQFSTVTLTGAGSPNQNAFLKGYIVATHYATEKSKDDFSTLFCEDPQTFGEIPYNETESTDVGRLVLAFHYANILRKLGHSDMASALTKPDPERLVSIDPESEIPVCEINIPNAQPMHVVVSRDFENNSDALFGLDANIFGYLREMLQNQPMEIDFSGLDTFPALNSENALNYGVSVLRDGSVFCARQNEGSSTTEKPWSYKGRL